MMTIHFEIYIKPIFFMGKAAIPDFGQGTLFSLNSTLKNTPFIHLLEYPNRFLVMAFGDLRSFEEGKVIYKEQEEKVCHHESKVQNLVIGYLIFGRCLFFGITQTSLSFKCKEWWLNLALTLSSTLVYFLLLLDAVTMLRRTQYQLDIIRQELIEICQRILVTQNQKDHVELTQLTMEAGESCDGLDFNFGFYEKMLMLDHFRIIRRKVHIYFTVSFLLAVIVIELYVSKYLLCN